jgi:hypothetical protein
VVESEAVIFQNVVTVRNIAGNQNSINDLSGGSSKSLVYVVKQQALT